MRSFYAAVAVVSMGLAFAAPLHAQTDPTTPPSRIGPEANGKDYQPTQGSVTDREKQAGVAASPDAVAAQDRALQSIDTMLLDKEHEHPPAPPQFSR